MNVKQAIEAHRISLQARAVWRNQLTAGDTVGITDTDGRWVIERIEGDTVEAQKVNPATGKPWQASRRFSRMRCYPV
jgi:hypothetical protein